MSRMQRFVEWTGVAGETLAIVGVCLVALIVGLVMYTGVPDMSNVSNVFKRETLVERLTRECTEYADATTENIYAPVGPAPQADKYGYVPYRFSADGFKKPWTQEEWEQYTMDRRARNRARTISSCVDTRMQAAR